MVCPSETPEGASVGLVKNLALLTNITVHAPSEPIHSVLDDLGIVRFDGSGNISPGEALDIFRGESMGVPPVRVYVNGDLAGAHSDPSKLCEELRYFKRHGAINVFTSIAWAVTGREVHICTDGGRFVRPLLVIDSKTGRPVLDDEEHKALFEKAKQGKAVWHDLVLSGAIEYLDGDEVEGSVIVMDRSGLTRDKRATHMEVSPSAMLGVVAGSIPYSDHNQAPRNTYQSAMGKQAIGIYASNYRHRFDTMTHTLNYPQKPMVSTHTARIMNCDNLPCGINTIVAIACFTGFNQVTFYRDPEGIAQKLNQNIVAH
jgi:DNA-directed RNA polymerase beta subunit